MGSGEFFFEKLVPLSYWIGVIVVFSATFLMIRYLEDKSFRVLFIFGSILLMTAFRMVFPSTFTTVTGYEPDASNYINIVSSWATSGLNFGVAGNYQHDFPLSFLIAFAFVKFGVPVETFFRFTPLFIYAIDIILVYALVTEVTDNPVYGAVGGFLLSFSSLSYWITVHYCPDLVGSLLYLISLILVYRFVKKGVLTVQSIMPVLVTIFMLILSHQLSTLYFIVTMFGLSLSTWFLKSPLKGKEKWFLLLGIYTYTSWFAYGTLVYPSFFNIYVYFHGFTASPQTLSVRAGVLDNVTFVIYPMLMFGLFLIGILQLISHIRSYINILKWPMRLQELRTKIKLPEAFVFSSGFVFVAALFIVGFGIPAVFPLRVLEVFLIGTLPFSSKTLAKLASANPSRKKTFLVLILMVVIVVLSIHRYYSQIQRRVLFV
jgi:hypothetical protein